MTEKEPRSLLVPNLRPKVVRHHVGLGSFLTSLYVSVDDWWQAAPRPHAAPVESVLKARRTG
jgi:hypothetical protein